MRIAWLAPANSIHTKRWVRALSRRGIEVHLLSQHPDPDGAGAAVPLTVLPYRGVGGYFLNALAVRRALRRIRPDLLNVHYASGYGTTAALAGFRPTILAVWGSDVYDFPIGSPIKRALLRWNLGHATAIASTSRTMAEQVRRVAPRLATPIVITPFGVDAAAFAPAPELRDPRFITIGTVKFLAPKYGIDVLIKAFASLRDDEQIRRTSLWSRLRLVIVGDGPQKAKLESLATALGVADRTQFIGAVAHEQVPAWLNRLDIYVAASRLDSESFGVAVVEASSCGLPVIVSDAGGLPEVVRDGKTGIVVPRENVAALSAALKCLVLDEELRAAMGEIGRRLVLDEYEWSDCVDRMLKCYEKLVAAGRSTGSTRRPDPAVEEASEQD